MSDLLLGENFFAALAREENGQLLVKYCCNDCVVFKWLITYTSALWTIDIAKLQFYIDLMLEHGTVRMTRAYWAPYATINTVLGWNFIR